MENELLKNSKTWIVLKDYIPSKYFRTLEMPNMEEAAGYTELKVIIEMSQQFADSLQIYVEKINMIGGFARIHGKLEQINGNSDRRKGKIEQIYLTEVEDRFNMVFLYKDGKEYLYYVKKGEVKELLENCELLSKYHRNGRY